MTKRKSGTGFLLVRILRPLHRIELIRLHLPKE
jgi:hypothetical protein